LTVKEIYDSGDQTLVVRLVYPSGEPDVIAGKLASAAGRWENEPLSLGELVYRLSNTEKPGDVRVSPSFAAVEWYIPSTWGRYAWPFKTLQKEDLDKVEGLARVTDKHDMILNSLPGLYHGIGIAVQTSRLEKLGGIAGVEEDVSPLMVFVDKRLIPKRNVILIAESNKDKPGIQAYALTAYKPAIGILESEGFKPPEIIEPIRGARIYRLVLPEKVFASKTEFELFARRLGDRLLENGITLFKHYAMYAEPTSKLFIPAKMGV